MDLNQFKEKLSSGEIKVPNLKAGAKVKGKVLKHTSSGVIVDVEDGAFVGFIYSKEAKELARVGTELAPGTEIEAELLDTSIRSEEGYFLISITKLLQYDIWSSLLEKAKKDEIITVIPTEANLGGLLVDMYGIKGFIPLSQLAPVHYPRVEDGDQEKIFQHLLDLIGKEFKVRIINIDEQGKRLILSEKEALREEREKILQDLEVGKEYEGVISGISSYGQFVTIGGGIEGLVHISEITYGHVDDIKRYGKVGDKVKVKVIGYDDGKISFSRKRLKEDPWKIIPKKFKVGDVIEGEVVRFVPYGVFVRVYDDINGLIHISELADKGIVNPAEVVKLGQKVKAKIILLDPKGRKLWLTLKVNEEEGKKSSKAKKSQDKQSSSAKKPVVKKKASATTSPKKTVAKKSKEVEGEKKE